MRLLKIELQKYLLTKWSLVSLILASAIIIFTMNDLIGQETSITYVIEIFIGLSYTKKLFIVAITIPLARLFVDDVANKYLIYVMNRTSIKSYTLNKVLISFFGAFVLSLGAFALIVIFYSARQLPLLTRNDSLRLIQDSFFTEIINSGKLSYILIAYAWNYSLSVAFWNVTGLLFSSYVSNGFIPYIAPFVISYYVEEYTRKFPPAINIYAMGRTNQIFSDQTLGINQLYITLFFWAITSLVGYLFYRQTKRKVPYA